MSVAAAGAGAWDAWDGAITCSSWRCSRSVSPPAAAAPRRSRRAAVAAAAVARCARLFAPLHELSRALLVDGADSPLRQAGFGCGASYPDRLLVRSFDSAQSRGDIVVFTTPARAAKAYLYAARS